MVKSGIGFHILYEQLDNDPAKNKLVGYLQKIQPRWINIMGGARRDQAFLFARQLKEHPEFKDMKIIFRNWPDDGNNVKPQYIDNPQLWIDHNIDFLKAGFTVLTDNESSADNMTHYGNWSAYIMDECGKHDWSVGVGRFSVGTVQGYGDDKVNQYNQLDDMWHGLARWGTLHVWTPNEYFDPTGTLSNGLAGRYLSGLKRSRDLQLTDPRVVIGEYGVVYRDANGGLDAGAGYKDPRCKLSGKQAARLSIEMWKQRYRDNGVDVSLYCYGDTVGKGWAKFRVDDDSGFMDELVSAAQNGELEPIKVGVPPVVAPPVVTPPAPPVVVVPSYTPMVITVNTKYRLTVPIQFVNVRSDAGGKFSIVGMVYGGEIVQAVDEKIGSDGVIWVKVLTFNVLTGWVSTQSGNVKFGKI